MNGWDFTMERNILSWVCCSSAWPAIRPVSEEALSARLAWLSKMIMIIKNFTGFFVSGRIKWYPAKGRSWFIGFFTVMKLTWEVKRYRRKRAK